MKRFDSLIEKNKGKLEEFEGLLGYSFKDASLLMQALIHRSYAFETDGRHVKDNERLEFLGDAVLDLAVGQIIFTNYPDMLEGDLTRLRAMLVNEGHLSMMAEGISIGRFVLLGKGEDSSDGRNKPSILSSTFEAVVGAIFYDGGYEAAAAFVNRLFTPCLAEQQGKMHLADSKSRLQELTQDRYNQAPSYVLESEEGPDHRKIFTVSVRFRGMVLAHGKATSKKEAEQQAAAEAFLKIDDLDIPAGT